MRTKPDVATTMAFRVSFSMVLQVAMTTCTNPSSGITHILTHALDDEWTRDDGNVRRVLVKLSDAHYWNTELNQQSCTRVAHAGRETRGMEHSRMRWVPIQPSSIGTVTRPRVTMWSDGGDTVERVSRER